MIRAAVENQLLEVVRPSVSFFMMCTLVMLSVLFSLQAVKEEPFKLRVLLGVGCFGAATILEVFVRAYLKSRGVYRE